MLVSQVLVISVVVATAEICTISAAADETKIQALRSKLEEALTKNSAHLFELQKLLLNPTKECYATTLTVEFGEINDTSIQCQSSKDQLCVYNCSKSEYNTTCNQAQWRSEYYLEYDICPNGLDKDQVSHFLLGYHTTTVLKHLDPLFYFLITFSNFFKKIITDDDNRPDSENNDNSISLTLVIDKLDTVPHEEDISIAGFLLLAWVRLPCMAHCNNR